MQGVVTYAKTIELVKQTNPFSQFSLSFFLKTTQKMNP